MFSSPVTVLLHVLPSPACILQWAGGEAGGNSPPTSLAREKRDVPLSILPGWRFPGLLGEIQIPCHLSRWRGRGCTLAGTPRISARVRGRREHRWHVVSYSRSRGYHSDDIGPIERYYALSAERVYPLSLYGQVIHRRLETLQHFEMAPQWLAQGVL